MKKRPDAYKTCEENIFKAADTKKASTEGATKDWYD